MSKILKILLLIETSRAWGRGLLKGIAMHSHLNGPWRFYNELDQTNIPMERLMKWRPDGLIIQANSAKSLQDLVILNTPAIIIEGDYGLIQGEPNIMNDWEATGVMGAEYFLGKGLQNFAFCGYKDVHWSMQRGRAFSERLAKEGYETHHYRHLSRFKHVAWSLEEPYIQKWLMSLPKPVGLMACNDDRGRNILEACALSQISVPDEIAVIGVDNDDLRCDLSDPMLTSIALNTEKAGFEAMELLQLMIQNKKASTARIIVRPTHVVERNSSNIYFINCPEIREAMVYIQDNSDKIITVNDVVGHLLISRRKLERLFRKHLNMSILKRIEKSRLEYALKLLATTNSSISEIAQRMGYSEVKYLSRFVHKYTQLSPREYRQLKSSEEKEGICQSAE